MLKRAVTVVLIAALAGCATPRASVTTTIPEPGPGPAQADQIQIGEASWYDEPYHGRRRASGEIYNMHEFTAAHPTFPFGTWVLVTSLKDNRSVEVRINDRGPHAADRIIDLSYAAAQQLGPSPAAPSGSAFVSSRPHDSDQAAGFLSGRVSLCTARITPLASCGDPARVHVRGQPAAAGRRGAPLHWARSFITDDQAQATSWVIPVT